MRKSEKMKVILGIVFSLFLVTGSHSVFAGIPEPGIVLYGQVWDNTGTLVTSGELVWTYTPGAGGNPITVTVQLIRIEATDGPFCYKAVIPLETAVPGYPVSANAIPLSATPVEYTRTAFVTGKNITKTDTVSISTGNRGTVQLVTLGAASLDDTDHDGLPDQWEQQIVDADPYDAIKSIADVLPGDDFDGDGETNATQYANGTDPIAHYSPDTLVPSLVITSHSNGQHVYTTSIKLIGTASDSGKGDHGIRQVTVNGLQADNDTVSGSGTANWSNVVTLSTGANPITVIAYDDSPRRNQTSQAITVYYDPLSVIYVSNGGDGSCNGHNPCWPNIQNGISQAFGPSIIEITQGPYAEDIVLDFDQVILLSGGWDANFTSNPSSTTIQGSITITNGTLIIENIILQ